VGHTAGQDRIEIFTLPASGPAVPVHKESLRSGGPESLVIDAAHGRAYTHLWKSTTWRSTSRPRDRRPLPPNGCTGSRGIALDAERGFLFRRLCGGKAVVLDVNKNGAVLSTLSAAPESTLSLQHAPQPPYLPGGTSQTMAILGVRKNGKLSLLSTVKTAAGAHCAGGGRQPQVWVCDPITAGSCWSTTPTRSHGRPRDRSSAP